MKSGTAHLQQKVYVLKTKFESNRALKSATAFAAMAHVLFNKVGKEQVCRGLKRPRRRKSMQPVMCLWLSGCLHYSPRRPFQNSSCTRARFCREL